MSMFPFLLLFAGAVRAAASPLTITKYEASQAKCWEGCNNSTEEYQEELQRCADKIHTQCKRNCSTAAARGVWGNRCYAQQRYDNCVGPPNSPNDCVWCAFPGTLRPDKGWSCIPKEDRDFCLRYCDRQDRCESNHAHNDAWRVCENKRGVQNDCFNLYFDPKYDLHCTHGGVRAWNYGPDQPNRSDYSKIAQRGSAYCRCPDGWRGAECRQCDTSSMCPDGLTCHHDLVDMLAIKPELIAVSCHALQGSATPAFFKGAGLTQVSVNLEFAPQQEIAHIQFLSQIDTVWKSDLPGDPDLGTSQSGFLTSPHVFSAELGSCTHEQDAVCWPPIIPLPWSKGKCINLKCEVTRWMCDVKKDNPTYVHQCPVDGFPLGLAITISLEQAPVVAGTYRVAFGFSGFGPLEFLCETSNCLQNVTQPSPEPTRHPIYVPTPPPTPGVAPGEMPENILVYFLMFLGPIVLTLLCVCPIMLTRPKKRLKDELETPLNHNAMGSVVGGATMGTRSAVQRSAASSMGEEGSILSFDNISAKIGDKDIIRGISGIVRPGECCAVMGPSGAGKTTLIDCLAGRKTEGVVGGNVYLGNRKMTVAALKLDTDLVYQDDVLPGMSTVYEYLHMHAVLRPAAVGQRPLRRLERVIGLMGLNDVEHSVIGDDVRRGLSGGEKKRVAIAASMLASPEVMFLDEPTSGLDSTTANGIMQAIAGVAQEGGKCVMLSIHQPSTEIYRRFDNVMLLSRNGDLLFLGPAEAALDHFLENGYPSEDGCNPAEFLLDMASLKDDDELKRLSAAYKDSELAKGSREAVVDAQTVRRRGSMTLGSKGTKRASFCTQFRELVMRQIFMMWRRPAVLVAHFLATSLLSLSLVLAFPPLTLGDETSLAPVFERTGFFFFCLCYFFLSALSVVSFWREERVVFLRERDAGCYTSLSFLASKLLCDTLILRVLPPVLFTGVCYPLVGLYQGSTPCLLFMAVLVGTNVSAGTLFMFLSVACPNMGAASVLCTFVSLFNFLFCGALAQIPSFKPQFHWIFRLSVLSYAYEIFMINEFVGRIFHLGYAVPGGGHLILPPQGGSNLLAQQGLCARFDSNASARASCNTDLNFDLILLYASPILWLVLTAFTLAFCVKQRR